MNDVKKPQDHLSKEVKPKVEKTDTGFTVFHRGVEVVIPTDALDDFEMLRDLGKMQDVSLADAAKLSLVPAVFTRFLGEAQGAKVLNVLRDKETGRVKIETASTFLFEVFGALNPES